MALLREGMLLDTIELEEGKRARKRASNYCWKEQRLYFKELQWSYIVSNPDFCNHHWFGYALLSFTAGMHGGCFWRAKEAHRA
jgi:hypothetical protein